MVTAFCRVAYIQQIDSLDKITLWHAYRALPAGLSDESEQWCRAVIVSRVAELLAEAQGFTPGDFVKSACGYLQGSAQK